MSFLLLTFTLQLFRHLPVSAFCFFFRLAVPALPFFCGLAVSTCCLLLATLCGTCGFLCLALLPLLVKPTPPTPGLEKVRVVVAVHRTVTFFSHHGPPQRVMELLQLQVTPTIWRS
jgi:hypothetical protein